MRQGSDSKHAGGIPSTEIVFRAPRRRFLDWGRIGPLASRFLDRGRILNTLSGFLHRGCILSACTAFPRQGLHSEGVVAFPRQGSHSEHGDPSLVFHVFSRAFCVFHLHNAYERGVLCVNS